jgi:hypothetical protein
VAGGFAGGGGEDPLRGRSFARLANSTFLPAPPRVDSVTVSPRPLASVSHVNKCTPTREIQSNGLPELSLLLLSLSPTIARAFSLALVDDIPYPRLRGREGRSERGG